MKLTLYLIISLIITGCAFSRPTVWTDGTQAHVAGGAAIGRLVEKARSVCNGDIETIHIDQFNRRLVYRCKK